MHMGGAALVKAIDATLPKARQLAARLLQASEDELVLEGGGFAVRGSERRIMLTDIAREAGAFGDQEARHADHAARKHVGHAERHR